MPATTGNAIIADAFGILNVFLPGESIPNNQAESALGFLNRMIGQWSQRDLLVPVVAREVFDITSNKGGPSNPYTIGSGADWNTTKPQNQNSIVGASLLLTSPSPDTEVPLVLYTDSMYSLVQQKELTNAQPTGLYYNPTYSTTDYGTINLWPVPDNATNDIVLYINKALARFTDRTTTYYVPEGYDDALTYNLAQRLAGPWGKQMQPDDRQLAVASLGVIKRANTKLFDLPNDATFAVWPRPTAYNINTGAG